MSFITSMSGTVINLSCEKYCDCSGLTVIFSVLGLQNKLCSGHSWENEDEYLCPSGGSGLLRWAGPGARQDWEPFLNPSGDV